MNNYTLLNNEEDPAADFLSIKLELILPAYQKEPTEDSKTTNHIQEYMQYLEIEKKQGPSWKTFLKLLSITFKCGIYNIFNYAGAIITERVIILLFGAFINKEIFLAIAYTKTIQSIFGDFVPWSCIVVINTEVGKLIGSNNIQKVSKVLLYGFIFSLFYSTFVFLPFYLASGYLLSIYTNLSSRVLSKINMLTLNLFCPLFLQIVNYCFTGYLQTVGLGLYIGKASVLLPVFMLAAAAASYFFSGDAMVSYVALVWTGMLYRLLVNIYYYNVALTEFAKPADLKIEKKKFWYFVKKLIGNSFLEILEFTNLEIVMLMSSVWLIRSEDAAQVLYLTFYSLYGSIVYAFKKMPFVAFSEFLGLKNSEMSWYTYYSFYKIMLVICVGFGIVYSAACRFFVENTFEENLGTKAAALKYFWLIYLFMGARPIYSYILDIYKALDMRVSGSCFAILTTLLTLGFFALASKNPGNDCFWVALSYPVPLVIIIGFSSLFLGMIDWEKKINKIEIVV